MALPSIVRAPALYCHGCHCLINCACLSRSCVVHCRIVALTLYLSRLIVRYALVQLLARARVRGCARTCLVIRLAVFNLLVTIANICAWLGFLTRNDKKRRSRQPRPFRRNIYFHALPCISFQPAVINANIALTHQSNLARLY